MSVKLEGFDSFIAKLKKLQGQARQQPADKKVSVGVLGKSGSDLVIIAASNEFGTADGLIPSRPFMRTAIKDPSLRAFVRETAKRFYKGEFGIDVALGRIGAFAASLVQRQIGSNMPPPNAPSTVARKKSSRTLIDTGRLRQAIAWVVK